MRKDEEVQRLLQAFDRAVERSNRPKSAAPHQPLNSPSERHIPSTAVAAPVRTPENAPIPKRASITEYTTKELQTLLAWVKSDGKLRTNYELADEMFPALPFSRRGSKIEAALRQVINISNNVDYKSDLPQWKGEAQTGLP